jgi:ABC-type oligopeptide transport system substrate-binding subunit
MTKDNSGAIWNDDLQCFWRNIYVVNPYWIKITLGNASCVDMAGAIKVATLLNPRVTRIDTVPDDWFQSDQDAARYDLVRGIWVATLLEPAQVMIKTKEEINAHERRHAE